MKPGSLAIGRQLMKFVPLTRGDHTNFTEALSHFPVWQKRGDVTMPYERLKSGTCVVVLETVPKKPDESFNKVKILCPDDIIRWCHDVHLTEVE